MLIDTSQIALSTGCVLDRLTVIRLVSALAGWTAGMEPFVVVLGTTRGAACKHERRQAAPLRVGTTDDEHNEPWDNFGKSALLKSGWTLRFFSPTDVIALQLPVEGGAADAEHFAGESLVTIHLCEDALDGGALDILEVGGG